MKILESTLKSFAILGINSNQTRSLNFKSALALIVWLLSAISSIIYLLYTANTFVEYIDSVNITTLSIVGTFIFVIILVWNVNGFLQSIESLDRIVQKRSDDNPNSKAIYTETNRVVEKWGEFIYFGLMKVSPQCLLFPKLIISYFTYLTTDLGEESFELPFRLWFPFDATNPTGYLFACALEYILLINMCITAVCSLNYGIGICSFLISIAKDIAVDLDCISESVKTKGNRAFVLKRLSEIIQLHSNVKQVVSNINEIFSSALLVLVAWSFSTICGSLLIIQLEISNNLVALITLLCELFWAVAFVFICCEFGERVTDAFIRINDAIDQLNWYLFPTTLWKILPTIIIAVQDSVGLQCVGSISCSRSVFKKVINTAFSWFTVLREFRN